MCGCWTAYLAIGCAISSQKRVCALFGNCEDICCTHESTIHSTDCEIQPFYRQLCANCKIPICTDCWLKLRDHDCKSKTFDGGEIPMSISNDHYYGFVNRFLVENQVTWLECAACSLIWTTMLVYYLEDPYGHLMKEPLGSPEARSKIRGNLFSFSMPWEILNLLASKLRSIVRR